MTPRDGHVRLLPLHVANKIAAGEVVERPASVAKELVENAIDAGARNIRISISQGGRKLVSVSDDGCGMSRDDAVLSLERQATSKILDVGDIEEIDTLGFRGEAIPSIASVSRFTMTTRRRDSDEGTFIAVNAGTLAEVRSAGCPPGTQVEVRDLFCNVPARRKFLRAYATEEGHVRNVFTVHALAHPQIGFALYVDGREACRLAPASSLEDRVRELFGPDFIARAAPLSLSGAVSVEGFIERPGGAVSSRRDQYVFVNSRPATAPAIAYAIREAYPRRQGDSRPAAVIFITTPPGMVDVNVHPAKREVRFRDNSAVRLAVENAIRDAISAGTVRTNAPMPPDPGIFARAEGAGLPERDSANPEGVARGLADSPLPAAYGMADVSEPSVPGRAGSPLPAAHGAEGTPRIPAPTPAPPRPAVPVAPTPVPSQVEFAVDPDGGEARPWRWFRFLAVASSGYLLVETDAGIVTIYPRAACERIAYERLRDGAAKEGASLSQPLLVPETARFTPPEAARIRSALAEIAAMGFSVEEFGRDTFKIDAVPQMMGGATAADVLATVARDLAEPGARRGDRWREELVAKSVARSFSRMSRTLDAESSVRLVEDLASCRMPYVSPAGKPTMVFTSTRELDRRFSRE